METVIYIVMFLLHGTVNGQTLAPPPINFAHEVVYVDGRAYDVNWDGARLSIDEERESLARRILIFGRTHTNGHSHKKMTLDNGGDHDHRDLRTQKEKAFHCLLGCVDLLFYIGCIVTAGVYAFEGDWILAAEIIALALVAFSIAWISVYLDRKGSN